MEVSGVNAKAYTSAAKGVDEEEELEKTQQEEGTEQAKNYGVSTNKKPEEDFVEISSGDLSESDVSEKAANYLDNILFQSNLTEKSNDLIRRYRNTFDVAAFIKSYGPFTSTAEISAAMYAATSGMIQNQGEQ